MLMSDAIGAMNGYHQRMQNNSPDGIESGFGGNSSSYSGSSPEWREAGGAYEVVDRASDILSRLLAEISSQQLPEVVYEVSPDGYARRVLPVLDDIVECAAWARRMVLDECMDKDSKAKIPRIDLAELSGVSQATLSRWSREPIQSEEGVFGPKLRDRNSQGDSYE